MFTATPLCPITICPSKELFSIFFISCLLVLEGCYKVYLQSLLLQTKPPQISQPNFTEEVLQPFEHLCGPPLKLLEHIFLMLEATLPVCRQQVKWGTFLRWLTHNLCQETIFHILQASPRLFPLHCTLFPLGIWEAQVPHENKC